MSNTSSSSQSQSLKVTPPPTLRLISSWLPNLCIGTHLHRPHRRTCNRWCRRRRDLCRSIHHHLIRRPSPSTTHVLRRRRSRQRRGLSRGPSRRRCVHRTSLLAMVFLHQPTHRSHYHRYYCILTSCSKTEINVVAA